MLATDEMLAFTRVADLGSFAKAAEELNVTPSAVSKLVSRIEDRLGVRLLTRTTRHLALTMEGALYLSRARDILALIERTEQDVSASRLTPKGRVRVNASTAIAKHLAMQILPDFFRRYPEVIIDLGVTDRVVDAEEIADGIDVVVGTGEVRNADLVVRKLRDIHRVICASPAYLARHGTPIHASDLLTHNCLTLSAASAFNIWPFVTGDGVNRMQVSGNFSCDNVRILFDMALAGHGIIRLADFVVGQAVKDGLLVDLALPEHISEAVPMRAIMPPGRHRAPRVQVFVDFIAERLARS